MKRIHVISLLIVCWILALIGAYFCINHHINNKCSYLRTKIFDDVEALFEGQYDDNSAITYADGLFFVCKNPSDEIHIKNTPIPQKPKKDFEFLYKEWKDKYGDISVLYDFGANFLKNERHIPSYEYGYHCWAIERYCFLGFSDDLFVHNWIFPYQIGIKKTYLNNYNTAKQAIDGALSFCVKNPQSWFYGRIRGGRSDGNLFFQKIWDCSNDYYTISVDTTIKRYYSHGLIGLKEDEELDASSLSIGFLDKSNCKLRTLPYYIGSVQNDYSCVLLAASQETRFVIEEITENVKKDKIKLERCWFSGITVLFLLFIVPLSIMEYKSNKRKAETLRERLLRLCNPQNYMRNYDKEKVDKANRLYQRLLQTKADDKESLMEIQEMAVSELGISFVEKEDLEELKEKVNPKNYLNPYNADKVTLANELYDMLCKKDLSYREFVEVKEKSKLL